MYDTTSPSAIPTTAFYSFPFDEYEYLIYFSFKLLYSCKNALLPTN